MLGILIVDKPKGLTSHDVVNKVRQSLLIKRVGHAGSLDPLATGVLVLAVGAATRCLPYLSLEPKVYKVEYKFGEETDTQDSMGTVTQNDAVPVDLHELIQAALPRFLGTIDQMPPMYSAVKKAGKPLYAYARQGIDVEREVRQIEVFRFDQLSTDGCHATFEIECSGGTYVRTLGHDLGLALGCGAHMTKLVRTQVGRFHLADCIAIEKVSEADLIPLADALQPMPMRTLNPIESELAANGNAFEMLFELSDGPIGILSANGSFLGIARRQGNRLQPVCVIREGYANGEI